jgi:hypothetical protein
MGAFTGLIIYSFALVVILLIATGLFCIPEGCCTRAWVWGSRLKRSVTVLGESLLAPEREKETDGTSNTDEVDLIIQEFDIE